MLLDILKKKKTTCQEGFHTNTNNTADDILKNNAGIEPSSMPIQGQPIYLGTDKSKDKAFFNTKILKGGSIVQAFPKPWKSDREWSSSNQPDKTSDTSYNVYWNTYLKDREKNGTVRDPSGYVLRCVDLIQKTGKKYAQIDGSGCFGGDEVRENNGTVPGSKLLTIDADKFIKFVKGPQKRGDYNNITCSIVNEDNKWICASNCVFTGSIAAGSGNNTGNNNIIDMASDQRKAVEKHGEQLQYLEL